MTTPAANAEGANGNAEGQEAPGGPDFGPVMDRIEQIDSQLGPVVEWVQSQSQQAQESPDPDADYESYINQLFAGQEEDPAGAEPPQQEVPQIPQFLQNPELFQQLIDRAVERGVEQRVGPLEQDRLQRQVQDILDELPGLQDPKVQQETVLAAQEIANEMGQPEAWRNPAFFRMAYLANLAQQRSDAEVPAGASGGGAQLEGGSGGNPGGGQEPSLVEQMLAAARGSSSILR